MHGHARALADGDGLADGLEHRVALVAHVREVDAPVLARDRSQGDELLGARIDGGRIDERSGHSHGPVLHPLAHQLPHLVELFGRRVDILHAQDYAPHLGEADVVHHVDGDAVALHDREVLRVPAPAQRVAVDDGRIALGFGALGGGRASLAGEVGGDALTELALGTRGIGDEHQAGLAHHVDEAGGDDAIAGVDGPRGGAARELAHGGDAVPAHPHVRPEPGVSGAVHHARVGDQNIEGGIVRRGSIPCLHAGARGDAQKNRDKGGSATG